MPRPKKIKGRGTEDNRWRSDPRLSDSMPTLAMKGEGLTRRELICSLAAIVGSRRGMPNLALVAFPVPYAGSTRPDFIHSALDYSALDYHGYLLHDFIVDGCNAHLIQPSVPLPGAPWVWRTMFWDAF